MSFYSTCFHFPQGKGINAAHTNLYDIFAFLLHDHKKPHAEKSLQNTDLFSQHITLLNTEGCTVLSQAPYSLKRHLNILLI